jgi:regulator of protease activity HflC (stomatin/prohibitin superfamily)
MYTEDVTGTAAANIGAEIIKKVITPNARSFCRLQGSNSTGKQLIGGDTRVEFQTAFQKAIQESCEAQGIEVLQALLTKIKPPEAIAEPVRKREIAKQQQKQFAQQEKQQEAEAKLATQKALGDQGPKLVEADQEVVKVVQKSKQEQEVALEGANRDLEVAIEEYHAAKDTAAAMLSAKQAEAAITLYGNEADAAGWQRSVEALGGDGNAFARFVLYQKLAPSYRSMQVNTADSPLMKVFEGFTKPGSDAKIDSSKIKPLQIDLPKDVVIPKIEHRIRKPAAVPSPAPRA